jgi:hypothetical protein
MDKELLQARIDEIQKALEQSMAQYHMLLGRLEEARYQMQQIDIQQLVNEGEAV